MVLPSVQRAMGAIVLSLRVFRRPASYGAVFLLGALWLSGCGTASHAPDSHASTRARRVASTFVEAYLDAPSKQAALRRIRGLASPVFLERAPSDYSAIYGFYREQAVAGPKERCRSDLAGSAPGRLCFTFYVVGTRFVPDTKNKGYAGFGYGLMFVFMTADGRKVDDVSYSGGARECKLGDNCVPARRDAVASAKKFDYPINFQH